MEVVGALWLEVQFMMCCRSRGRSTAHVLQIRSTYCHAWHSQYLRLIRRKEAALERHLCAGMMVTSGGQQEKGLGLARLRRTRPNPTQSSEDCWREGSGRTDGGIVGECEASMVGGAIVRFDAAGR